MPQTGFHSPFIFSYRSERMKALKSIAQIDKLRGIQPLCEACQKTCKVKGGPNSTLVCFDRVPKTP
jgi:hypothetical protein